MRRDRPAATLTEPTAARALYKEYRALQPYHHPRRTTPRPPRSPCHCPPYKGGWWYGPCTPYCPVSCPVPCMYEIGAREGFIPAIPFTQARLGQAVVMLVQNSSPTLDASENGSGSSAAAPPAPPGPAQRNRSRLRWAVPERYQRQQQPDRHTHIIACRALSLPYIHAFPIRLGCRPAAGGEQQGPWEGGSSVCMGSALSGHATIPIARSGKSSHRRGVYVYV